MTHHESGASVLQARLALAGAIGLFCLAGALLVAAAASAHDEPAYEATAMQGDHAATRLTRLGDADGPSPEAYADPWWQGHLGYQGEGKAVSTTGAAAGCPSDDLGEAVRMASRGMLGGGVHCVNRKP